MKLGSHNSQVPREALKWERRAPMLLEEILDSQADIICLQEVNRYSAGPVLLPSTTSRMLQAL